MGESPLPEAKQVNQGPIRRTPRRVMHSLMVLSACDARIERKVRPHCVGPPPAQREIAKALRTRLWGVTVIQVSEGRPWA